jgi:ATP phosphoribosyltransferase regulatory subunit
LSELQALLDGAEAAGLRGTVAVDLGAVADFAYYTGPTFQVFVPGLGSTLGGGGRYDRLMQQFGLDLPAVGFSLCLDWMVERIASTALADELVASAAPREITGQSIEQRFRSAAEARARGEVVRLDLADS